MTTKSLNDQLFAACEADDAAQVEALVGLGADTEAVNSDGLTPLTLVSMLGKTQACLALIKRGANVNTKDKNKEFPLGWAAFNGQSQTCLALLENGADINAKDNKGYSALASAASRGHVETCLILLARGADMELSANNGRTALAMTAMLNSEATCIALLNHGADLESRDNDGWTPLALAVMFGSGTCVPLIDRGANLESRDNKGHTPLELAAINNLTDDFLRLLARGANPSSVLNLPESLQFGHTILDCIDYPLHSTARLGMTIECIKLLELGHDFQRKDKLDRTPMECADTHEETQSAMRSWLARQEANRLMEEMAAPKP